MRRRVFLKAALAGTASMAAVARRTQGDPMPKRPNVLFLFTDDQRHDTVAALGNPDIRTPTLDRLAAGSTVFTGAHIQGSTVPAVCLCSRACLLTGRTLFRAPRDTGRFALWPEVFRKAGYATFGTGKWHNGPAAYARSFTDGGAIFFGGMSNHLKVPIHDFDPTGRYPKEDRRIGKAFSSTLFSDAAVDFLKRRRDPEPFFAYVSYTAPHDPRMPPPKYDAMYDRAAVPLPASFMPEHPFDNGELKIRDEKLAPFPRTPEVVREHLAAYYGMISHVDFEMGRVLQALEETGRADDTIVVFAGDNGLAVGRHGLMGKQNLYDHSVRVPLMIRAPGGGRGTRTAALCALHDVFPTVADLAGLTVPQTVEGKSLAPLVRGEDAAVRTEVGAAYKDCQRMVRDERFKLIWYPEIDRVQLFDLEADPHELTDLAADPDHADRLGAMKTRLAAWQEAHDDPGPRLKV